MTDRPPVSGEPSTEPVDSLHEAIDATMPALIDIDPDWQSRWSTAALLLNELERRGWTLARATPPSLDADAVIEGLIAVRERQHERGDDCYEQTESMKPWDREAWHTAYDYIEARDLRLTSKEERCARFRHDEHCEH